MTDIHQALEETGKRTEWVRVRRWRQRPTDDGVVTEVPPSEIIEAARNLPRAKIVNLEKTEWFEDSYQLEGPGRWLVVPVEGTD